MNDLKDPAYYMFTRLLLSIFYVKINIHLYTIYREKISMNM